MLSAVVAALGGGLFESPKAAAIATLTDEGNRRRYYSLSGVVGGLGVALGTQAGALLIRADFATVSLAAGSVYLVTFVLMLALLPPVRVATEAHGMFGGLALALRDRVFFVYAALMVGYWFMATQFNLSLVLRATEVAGSAAAVAWIYGINSGATILLGYPLPRLIERRASAFAMLVLGIALTVIGMVAVGLAAGVPALLAAVAVISLGTVLCRPGEQTVTANLADPAARGSYFGVAALSLAIGGGLGNFAGGVIYDYGETVDRPELPWLVYGLVGAAAAAGLWRMRGRVREPRPDAAETPHAPAAAGSVVGSTRAAR